MPQPTPEEMRKATAKVIKMREAVDVLQVHVEATCGLFLDSRRGWERLATELHGLVAMQVREGKTREEALRSQLIHGEGHPDPKNVRHVSTLGERIDACAAGGFNERTLSGLCVASIYGLWEDRSRGEIAKALGIDKNAVRSALFSDLRRMRHAILHAGGRIDDSKPFEVLKWFKRGDMIVLTPDRFHEIIEHLRQFPEGLHTPSWNPFPSLKS